MTDWTTIADAQVDPKAPVTSELMTALRDNPLAIAAGATGAPPIFSGWYPYDTVTHGDGNDGVFYDYSVDGAVSSVEVSGLDPRGEYLLALNGVDPQYASTLKVDVKSSTGVYVQIAASDYAGDASYLVELRHLVLIASTKKLRTECLLSTAGDLFVQDAIRMTSFPYDFAGVRVRVTTGNILGGTFAIYKRGGTLG